MSGHARYVGRVGALAIALGVGSALAAMPLDRAVLPDGFLHRR